uniref:N-acetyltransferase domain-containing protein n=1 Tax=Anopheles albimanus TaxID=7167 RepID=A0A8W7JV92_ANOAL
MSSNPEPEEPLRLASADEVNQLISIYERHLPPTVQFVLLLENIKRMQATICDSELENASHRFRKSVYVLKDTDIVQHATFLAIGLEKDLFIIPHTLQDPPIELTDAIRGTKFIRWELHPVFVIEGNNEIKDHLIEVAEARNLKLQVWSDCLNYWMPQQKASKITYTVPHDVTLRPLQEEHAQFLNDTWPYRYEQSKWYIETAIRVNGGFGLFDTKDGSLVACVFKNDHDSVGDF